MPTRSKMPSTLKRSSAKAQRTWIKTHDAAVREYGEGERAHRTAFSALKAEIFSKCSVVSAFCIAQVTPPSTVFIIRP